MHLHKTAIHLKKVASVGGTDPAVEVTLRYPTSHLGPADMGMLMAYVGQAVKVTIDARDIVYHDPTQPTPLDRALEQAENGHKPAERMRPLPHERCGHCGREIGEDPEAAFWVPFAGKPVPMHGACLAEVPDGWQPEDSAEDQDAIARLAGTPAPEGAHRALEDLLETVNLGPTVPVSEWTEEERQQATAWVEAVRAHLAGPPGVDAAIPERPAFLDEKASALPVALVSAAEIADGILGPEGGVPVTASPSGPSDEATTEAPVRVVPGRGRGGRR